MSATKNKSGDLFKTVESLNMTAEDNTASPDKMTPIELRATTSLAAIYGLRMFGMFSILPIFAIYASSFPEHPSAFMIGLAFGAYGLT